MVERPHPVLDTDAVRDSRLVKMHAQNRMKDDINASYIYQCENSGLLVIDPDTDPVRAAALEVFDTYQEFLDTNPDALRDALTMLYVALRDQVSDQ